MAQDSGQKRSADSLFLLDSVEEPYLSPKIRSKYRYWLFTIIGLSGYVLMVLIYLFAAAIFIFRSLRALYLNWAIISLLTSILVYLISSYVINKKGASTLINETDYLKLHPYFGRIRRIQKAKIFTIRLIKEPSFLSFLGFGDQRRVVITTIQATYDIDLSHFAKEEEISAYFQNLAEAIEDEYYTTFRRIQGDNRAIVRNLFSDRLASIGILIICIYVFFALWGVASMLLFPSNSLYSNALFLKNPEWIPMGGENVILHPPSGEYLFGTDFLGRDLFARMV